MDEEPHWWEKQDDPLGEVVYGLSEEVDWRGEQTSSFPSCLKTSLFLMAAAIGLIALVIGVCSQMNI